MSDARAGDGGVVTVEAAIALSAAVLLLAMFLSGIACAIAQIRCVDAAGEAARLAARGDEVGAREIVGHLAPDGARLELRTSGDRVVATVSANPVGGLLPITVRASATAARQDVNGTAGWAASGSGLGDAGG